MAYSVSEIVERAHNRTERRTDQQKLDLVGEFWDALAELCAENRFWWTRVTGSFSTVAADATYDLVDELNLAEPIIISEVESVWRVPSESSKTELQPILEQNEIADARSATTSATPSRYIYEADGTLRLGAPADAVHTLRVIGWASVAPGYAEATEAVPLVPAWLHYGLVGMLERRIWEHLLGQEDPRFVVADRKYQRFVANANRRNFTSNRIRQFGSGDAVRSHGN